MVGRQLVEPAPDRSSSDRGTRARLYYGGVESDVLAGQRRNRRFRQARLVVLALVVGYFFLPYGVQVWIPVWLPFSAAVGLELQFFLGPFLGRNRDEPQHVGAPDRGPQRRDLEELGWPPWSDDEDADAEALEPAPPLPPEAPTGFRARHPYASRVAEAFAALAVVAGILFYASRPHGWSAVSREHRAQAEALFSREATAIAGHPAVITCDTSGRYVGIVQDADGLAQVGGSRAYLVPRLCDALYQLAFKHRVQSFPRAARAIAVLAHEAWHLHGVAAEGLANCYAFQSGVRIGTDLGLSQSKARAMMREQLATNATDSADPRYLVPPGCRNSGPYDLHPGSEQFP
jgi:hypothetical protein